MKIFPLGFRKKMALWSAAASGLAVLGFSATSVLVVFDNMRDEADAELRQAAELVKAAVREGDSKAARRPGEAQLGANKAEVRVIELTDSKGKMWVDELGNWPAAADLEYADGGRFRSIRENDRSWRLMAKGESPEGIRVMLAIDIQGIRREVKRMVRAYLLAVPAATALVALGSWWVAGRAANPIRAIAAAAEQISAEKSERRVPALEVEDEISRLARVLNEMIGRLQESYAQAQRFSSDASHELRTPIAVLQGKIEEALQREGGAEPRKETLAELAEQVGRLKAIVESLLMFSRADGGQLQMGRERVDLGIMLEEMREDVEGIAEPDRIRVDFSAAAGLWVKGDPRLLRMALFNLLQNAVKYNRPGGGGGLRCGALQDGGFVRVRVENTGAPILEENREAIFERFFRGSESVRPGVAGAGLGLSLARMVARAHGGDVRVVDGAEGWNVFEMTVAAEGSGGGKSEV